jgi:NADPH-dependent glutamate synthase beta subunit-like oxidoreductase
MLKFTKAAEEAPCKKACPAGIDIPRYIRLIRQGKFDDALAVIREKIPFPSVCGHVCFHPCEDVCQARYIGGAVAINALKRFVAEKGSFEEKPIARFKGKRIAIIGSGPGGLTAAYYLAKLGHRITVFEALSKPGGMLRTGIPRYILPENVLDNEINAILSLGIELRLNTTIRKLADITDLSDDRPHAVLLATGLPVGSKLSVPGVDLEGVFTGVEFLHDVGTGRLKSIQKKVIVLGGGGVACDVARTACRLGASEVHIACVEPKEMMPAPLSEIEEAEREGVIIHPLRAFTRILGDGGRVTGVECLKLRWMKFDEEGGLQFDSVKGSKHVLEGDMVVFAVGQTTDLELISAEPEIKIMRRRTIVVDPETLQTGRSDVFAIGDLVSGPQSVIQAIAMGREAASSMDKYLGGNGIIEEKLAPPEERVEPLLSGLPVGFRVEAPKLSLQERLKSFTEVDFTYSEASAIEEATRCLMCDQPILADGTICTVCMICQMICALKFTGNSFNLTEAAIKLKRTEQGTCEAEFTDKCDNCGFCARYCSYGALARDAGQI